MSFFAPQNPGIGGLDELTNAEEIFLTTLAGLSFSEGEVLTIVSGAPSWEPSGGSSSQWDHPYGDAEITYDVDGNVETKVVGVVTLEFFYDIDGNVDYITDGSNIKTFTYDVDGNVTDIVYT